MDDALDQINDRLTLQATQTATQHLTGRKSAQFVGQHCVRTADKASFIGTTTGAAGSSVWKQIQFASLITAAGYLPSASAAQIYSPILRSIVKATATSRTLALTDSGKVIKMTASKAGGAHLRVPSSTSVAFSVGTQIDVIGFGTGIVTVIPVTTGVILRSVDSARKLSARYAGAILLRATEANTWWLGGSLAT